MNTPPRPAAGFTLLEVLAAFVLFSVTFAALIQVLSGALYNTRNAQEMTEAGLWAASYLNTLGVETPLEEGVSSGEFDDQYRYEAEIRLYDDGETDPALDELIPIDLLEVDLTVYWGEPPRLRQARFQTLRSADRNLRQGIAEGRR